jgi:four helix bundle protein
MTSKTAALQERTHRFFTRVIRFCEGLPENRTTAGIGEQLTDSAGSAESCCRVACRARSPEEFIARIAVAAEEADESKGWLSALLTREYGDAEEARVLIREAGDLTAIFCASRDVARRQLHQAGPTRTSASEADVAMIGDRLAAAVDGLLLEP